MVPRPLDLQPSNTALQIIVPIRRGTEVAAAPEPHAPSPVRRGASAKKTRQAFRSDTGRIHRGHTPDAQGRSFVTVAIGNIVVHELFQAGGGRSSTFTSGFWSSSRSGEAPDGSAGLTEQVLRWRVAKGVSTRKVQRRWIRWYRRLYGASM